MSGSAQGPVPHGTVSVLDFLYHDARRVGSFLAQFQDEGILQSTKITAQSGSSSAQKYGASGKASLAITGGAVTREGTETTEEKSTGEKTFDPFWSNALTFLDEIQGRSLLREDLSAASIGSLVLVRGSLVVLDLAMLKDFWRAPNIRKLILAGAQQSQGDQGTANRHQRRASASGNKLSQPSEAEVLMDMIESLPHSTQGYIISEDTECWFSMKQEAMVTQASDLLLKYGTHLGKEWSVVGIVDARPGSGNSSYFEDMARATIHSNVSQMLSQIAIMARPQFGRPDTAFGITPLIIYRTVNTAA